MDTASSAEVRNRLLGGRNAEHQHGSLDSVSESALARRLRSRLRPDQSADQGRNGEPEAGPVPRLRPVVAPTPGQELEPDAEQRSPGESFPFGFDEKKVFQDETLIAYIRREHFKRQKIFRLDDAHYGVRFHYASDNAKQTYPSIMSLLSAFRKCLETIVGEIRRFYERQDEGESDPEKFHRQMYLTVISSSLLKSINSGNFSIHENESLIVSSLLHDLMSFLRSNQEVPLDNSFKVDIRILSVHHTKKKIREGKGFKLHVPTGSSHVLRFRASPTTRQKHTFVVPEGFPTQETFFINKCVLVAIILGIYHRAFECGADEGKMWPVLSQIHSKTASRSKRAGKEIVKAVKKLAMRSGISLYGPHSISEVVPEICQSYNNIQVMVICKDSEIIYMYPPEYNATLRPIYLLQSTSEDSPVAHVDLIISVKTFSAKYGLMCPVCFKIARSQYLVHSCTRAQCSICRRILSTETGYVDNTLRDTYCTAQQNSNVSIFCDKCKKTASSVECFSNHQKRCIFAEYCEKCSVPIYKGNYASLEEAKRRHKCHEKFCRYCTEKYEEETTEEHMCTFKPVRLPKVWNNIGVLHFSYVTVYGENNIITMEEIACSIVFEAKEKENFSMKSFWHSKLQMREDSHKSQNEEDDFRLPYLTHELLASCPKSLSRNIMPAPFGQKPSKRKRDRIETKSKTTLDRCLLGPIIAFLIGSRFQAYTFITDSEMGMVSPKWCETV